MIKKEQGDTRQTAIYSHLHPSLAHPVLLAIGGHEKGDRCLDQKHFTGVKLTAVPVIWVVRSPDLAHIVFAHLQIFPQIKSF